MRGLVDIVEKIGEFVEDFMFGIFDFLTGGWASDVIQSQKAHGSWLNEINIVSHENLKVNLENQNYLLQLGDIVATFAEAQQSWVDYVLDLKAQLAAANETAAAAKAAADKIIADDATEDAAQLAALQQQLADQLSAALEGVKNPPVVQPDPEPTPDPEPEAPVDVPADGDDEMNAWPEFGEPEIGQADPDAEPADQ